MEGNNNFGISNTNPLFIKADKLAKEIYASCRLFPKDEIFGLTSQLRRAALSVILNIVEGFARQGENEFRRFLIISFGSLKETTYLLDFAHEQKYLNQDSYQRLLDLANEVSKISWSILYGKKEK